MRLCVAPEVPQREGAATEVEALVLDTLADLSVRGFPPMEVAAALNTVEFNRRESPRKRLPRGLQFSRQMAQELTYDKVPLRHKSLVLSPKPLSPYHKPLASV